MSLHVDVVQDDLRARVQRRVAIVFFEGGRLIVKDVVDGYIATVECAAREVRDLSDGHRALEAFAANIEGRSIFATEPHELAVCPFRSGSELPLTVLEEPFRLPA